MCEIRADRPSSSSGLSASTGHSEDRQAKLELQLMSVIALL